MFSFSYPASLGVWTFEYSRCISSHFSKRKPCIEVTASPLEQSALQILTNHGSLWVNCSLFELLFSMWLVLEKDTYSIQKKIKFVLFHLELSK